MGEGKRKRLLAAKVVQDNKAERVLWPLATRSTQQSLESWFVEHGIDPTQPGLHDTPEFLREEARNPMVLEMLARLVEARSYSQEELAQAERKTLVAAEAVRDRVARDGRPGMCVVGSNILSRMLDELGVWNYTAKSNLVIKFPPSISLEPLYFFGVDRRDVEAPHAVVVAPPFTVVDVTARHQLYDSRAMAQWLPPMVISKEMRPYRVSASDLISSEIQHDLRRDGLTAERFLERYKPHALELMRQLPPREVMLNGGYLRYAFIAVGGYQQKLRDLDPKSCSVDGKTPIDIFEQDVLPKL